MWIPAVLVAKTSSPGLLESLYEVIPLKPLTQPVKVLVVIPVYVIISSSTFSRPYSFGNPFVVDTVIVSDVEVIPDVNVVTPTTTSGVKLSNLMYWSKLSPISTTPPLCSWEM